MEPRLYELQGIIKNVHNNYHEFHSNSSYVCSCISVIMPGDFKVVCIKQVFHFNSVHINEVTL